MARRYPQKQSASPSIPLQRPDQTAPDPFRKTLVDIAHERGLFEDGGGNLNDGQDTVVEKDPEPPIDRLGEAILWSISLAMLHFTFDVLVQHQYAVEISWPGIFTRSLQAFVVILVLFYIFHPHPSPSLFSPRLPPKHLFLLHQLLFLFGSVSAGCYLIYITNEHGYLAVMKRAPPVGCMWIWSVIELDLKWALASLLSCGTFLWWGKYSYL